MNFHSFTSLLIYQNRLKFKDEHESYSAGEVRWEGGWRVLRVGLVLLILVCIERLRADLEQGFGRWRGGSRLSFSFL